MPPCQGLKPHVKMYCLSLKVCLVSFCHLFCYLFYFFIRATHYVLTSTMLRTCQNMLIHNICTSMSRIQNASFGPMVCLFMFVFFFLYDFSSFNQPLPHDTPISTSHILHLLCWGPKWPIKTCHLDLRCIFLPFFFLFTFILTTFVAPPSHILCREGFILFVFAPPLAFCMGSVLLFVLTCILYRVTLLYYVSIMNPYSCSPLM